MGERQVKNIASNIDGPLSRGGGTDTTKEGKHWIQDVKMYGCYSLKVYGCYYLKIYGCYSSIKI